MVREYGSGILLIHLCDLAAGHVRRSYVKRVGWTVKLVSAAPVFVHSRPSSDWLTFTHTYIPNSASSYLSNTLAKGGMHAVSKGGMYFSPT